jgi:hypothetical protein
MPPVDWTYPPISENISHIAQFRSEDDANLLFYQTQIEL